MYDYSQINIAFTDFIYIFIYIYIYTHTEREVVFLQRG
jgi:hypothetical protein